MKIVQMVTRSDSVGGAQVHVRDLCIGLLARGYKVTVIVGGDGPFLHQLKNAGIHYEVIPSLVRSIQPRRDMVALHQMRRTLASLSPDLVACHSSKAGWLGRLAARSLGMPAVFTAHGWAFTDGVSRRTSDVYALAERLAAPLADRIITVSDYDRSLALKRGIAHGEKLVTVHNGVPDVHEGLRATFGADFPRIVMVSRFDEPKDHRTLVTALGTLTELPWELDLIGDGPLRPVIEAYVDSLGLTERVHFLGSRDDVAQCLARAQIFALISRWEGLPLSILEAMRAGLPVIASDVGGVGEAVIDGKTGFLIPRGRVNILSERLRRVISSPETRRYMGINARQRYVEGFTFEHMFERTMQVYQDVVERGIT